MPAAVASATLYNDDSASPMTMDKPASTAANDLLVAVVSADSGAIGDITVGTTGFTAHPTVVNGAGQFAKVMYKVAGASEPTTYGFPYNTGAAAAGIMFRVTGADTTPVVLVASNYNNSNPASLDANTLTPTGANDVEIVILTNSCGGSTLSYAVPTGGYVDHGKTQASTTFQGLAAASRQLASASATGAQTWTSVSPTGKQAGTFNILIASAGGAAPAPPEPVLITEAALVRASYW